MTEIRCQRTDVRNPITKVIISLLLFSLFFPRNLQANQWKELKGEHSIIYFNEGEKFAKQVLDKTELYYKQIASDLGYQRYSDFWIWEKRCKIYLYKDHDAYVKAMSCPVWSHGQANYKDKTVSSYVGSNLFLDAILPHELGHLIFRDFVGFEGEVPLWLDEGVAQWQERAKPNAIKNTSTKLLWSGQLIPLKTMMNLDIRKIEDEKMVRIFYAESASIVDFLIRKYGISKFTTFCRELRDGKLLEEALKSAYSPSIFTIEDLEREWREYLLQ